MWRKIPSKGFTVLVRFPASWIWDCGADNLRSGSAEYSWTIYSIIRKWRKKELLTHCDTILIKYAGIFKTILDSHASHATSFRNSHFLVQILKALISTLPEQKCRKTQCKWKERRVVPVANTFLSRLELIWLIFSLQISKISKIACLAKRSGSQWVKKNRAKVQQKCKNRGHSQTETILIFNL